MKRVIVLALIGLLFGTLAFAGLEGLDVQQRLISVIKQCNSVSRNTAIRIGNLSQEGTDLVTNNPSDFDTGDKTKLGEYKVLLTDLKDAADAVIAYDWGNIE